MTFSEQVSNLISKLQGDINKIPHIVVDAVSKDMAQTAQRHFDKAVPDVPADDPNVVVSRSVSGNTAEVRCSGNQVLYIEFGAGHMNASRNTSDYLRLPSGHMTKEGFREATTIVVQGRIIPAHGFSKFGLTEIAPRPFGIYPLGYYDSKNKPDPKNWAVQRTAHQSRGSNDWWVYRGSRISNNSQPFEKRPNAGLMWTTGIAPVRALWRARSSAISKLFRGRLKLK